MPTQVYDYAEFAWVYFIPSVFAIIFIIRLGDKDVNAYWNLPLLSIAMYFFYSTYLSAGEKLKKLDVSLLLLSTADGRNISVDGKSENLRKAQALCLAVILVIPMLTSGVTGQLLDGAMRQASIRRDNANAFIKEPYANLIPSSLKSATQPQLDAYVKFDNVSILMQGLGSTTIVEYVVDDVARKMEVPTNEIIVP